MLFKVTKMNVNTQREQNAQDRALGNASITGRLEKEKERERKDQREMRKSEDAKRAVLRGA